MRRSLISLVVATLTACSTTNNLEVATRNYGSDIAPIPGSITYSGQPRTQLKKAPSGTTFEHELNDGYGNQVIERYQVQTDRTLKIISRQIFNLP